MSLHSTGILSCRSASNPEVVSDMIPAGRTGHDVAWRSNRQNCSRPAGPQTTRYKVVFPDVNTGSSAGHRARSSRADPYFARSVSPAKTYRT